MRLPIAAEMRAQPVEDLGFARIDHQRAERQGFPEVILGLGKSPDQIAAIAQRIVARGHTLLVTRADRTAYDAVHAVVPAAEYHQMARAITCRMHEVPAGRGTILIAAAGTSDLPVAEEAAVTAEVMGNTVDRLYDVGVAGLHRLLREHNRLRAARVIVVVAGMEGALPSVVAGLVSVPVIAVPTSIGYGASFHGLAALLGHAEQLRQRRVGGQHRQRLRRRLHREPDQPPAPDQERERIRRITSKGQVLTGWRVNC